MIDQHQMEETEQHPPVGEETLATRAREYLKTVLVTLLVALFLKSFVVEAFRIPSGSMEETLQVGDFLLVNKLAYGIRTPRFIPLTSFTIPTLYMPLFKHVQRGDVLVFEFPGSSDTGELDRPVNYIKRCIGLPGDVVEIQDGQVFVNGVSLGAPPTARVNDGSGISHRRSPLFPWGAGFTEDHYGPLRVPKKGDRVELTADNLSFWRSLILREGHALAVDSQGVVLVDGKPTTSYFVQSNYYFVMGDNRRNSLDSRYWGFVPEENLIGEALLVYWSWDPDVAASNLWEKLKSIRWNRIGTLIR
jgi:signal peptidase I